MESHLFPTLAFLARLSTSITSMSELMEEVQFTLDHCCDNTLRSFPSLIIVSAVKGQVDLTIKIKGIAIYHCIPLYFHKCMCMCVMLSCIQAYWLHCTSTVLCHLSISKYECLHLKNPVMTWFSVALCVSLVSDNTHSLVNSLCTILCGWCNCWWGVIVAPVFFLPAFLPACYFCQPLWRGANHFVLSASWELLRNHNWAYDWSKRPTVYMLQL